ncbi:uncharacterized protein LOC135824508 isoform X2 [Sycon ciliatum]|uniref:uncharacterized protein LOC135824508 isoform X2 n=1 Tax=Sycon ciliatum TaxID=27933 RepID=UPI0031F6CCC0
MAVAPSSSVKEQEMDAVDIALVALVKTRPVLWDHSLAFECKERRQEAWQEIIPSLANTYLSDAANIEKRWKLIRDRYARERKKMLQTGRTPNWHCWDHLHFLKDTVRSRNRRSSQTQMNMVNLTLEMKPSSAAPRQLTPRQQTPMKYFQVSFPEGGQMKAEAVDMEPRRTDSSAAAAVSTATALTSSMTSSAGAAATRSQPDLRLTRHRVEAARKRSAAGAMGAVAGMPHNGNGHNATAAADGSASDPMSSSPAKVSCLTSVLPEGEAAVTLDASDSDVVASSSVPASGGGLPSPSRIVHSTVSVDTSLSSPHLPAAGGSADPGGKVRSAFVVPMETTSVATSRSRGGSNSYSASGNGQQHHTTGGGVDDGSQMDAEALFGMHVAATMRRLPCRHRFNLQLSISQCIAELPWNELGDM